jgi:two-component system, sensor histidine kinase and response regulator
MEKILKILIVEDNPSDVELMREEVKSNNIQFIDKVVETKEEYIKMLKDFKPDLILSDYSLPTFDGLLALQLREELATNVPFILVTGTLNEATALKMVDSGADDYIIKGHITRIGAAIEAAVEKRLILKRKTEAEEKVYILLRAIEQNPVSILLTDINGNIEYVNPKFTWLTGYAENEVLGKNPRILKSGTKSPDYYKNLWETITAGKEWYGEFENRKKNGATYFESALISPITNEKGNITHFLAVKEDITEKKAADEVIRNYSINLEDIVKKRTIELEMARDRAESADKLKSSFLLNVSHELRTPLNSIIGFSGILLQQITGPLNEEQKKQLAMVQSSGRHLLSLINDILDISKIDAGELKPDYETFNLQELIEEVKNLAQPFAEDKGIIINFINNPEIGKIECDKKRVYQILINLINNAVKFTEKGSVTITCYRENNSVAAEVSDTGIGIKESDFENIFNPFFQLENSLTRKFDGSGLGLSITRKLLDMLGGSINVKSEYGKGSTFTVTLPLTTESKQTHSSL